MIFKRKKDTHSHPRHLPHESAVSAHLEKELAAHKPHVHMDEGFHLRLKNELMHEFNLLHRKRTERSGLSWVRRILPFLPERPPRFEMNMIRPEMKEIGAPRGFLSRNWVKGMVGVLAVVMVSAATLYINRYQFLSMLVPTELQSTVPAERRETYKSADNLLADKSNKDVGGMRARSVTSNIEEPQTAKKSESEAPVTLSKNNVPSGEVLDDKAVHGSDLQTVPAPEAKQDNSFAAKRSESAKEKLAAADESESAGVSSTAMSAPETPALTLEYRFGGRPTAFEDIKRLLDQGVVPEKSLVKMDDLVNTFSFDDQVGQNEPLSVTIEAAACPWNADNILVLITLHAGNSVNNAAVAENTAMKLRFFGLQPAILVPAGSYLYAPINNPLHAASSISGTYLPGDQSSVLIELPAGQNVSPGQVLVEGKLSYTRNGDTNILTIPFALTYAAKPGEPAGDKFRLATAMMYWGKILAGQVSPDQEQFGNVLKLLDRIGTREAAAGRNRLSEAVKLTQQLTGK